MSGTELQRAEPQPFEVEGRVGAFWMYRWEPCCGCGSCPAASQERRRVICPACSGRGCYLARFADNHFTACRTCRGLGYAIEFRAVTAVISGDTT